CDRALGRDLGAHGGVHRRPAHVGEARGRRGRRRRRAAARARGGTPARTRAADARGAHRRRAPCASTGAGRGVQARGPAALATVARVALGREARRMSTAPGSTRRAVVLLSGGLDSATCLAWARAQGFECHTLAVDYGQRHRVELGAARRVAAALGARDHREVVVDLRAIGGSSLTADTPVPKLRDEAAMAASIPSTYVPARNTVFLAVALGLA